MISDNSSMCSLLSQLKEVEKERAMKLDGFKYIGIQEGVCGNRPTILGTRLEPEVIVHYETKHGAMLETNRRTSRRVLQIPKAKAD